MRTSPRPITTSRIAARQPEAARRTRQTILALAAASALALCSIAIARAETWVTVNADGSVTRTEVASSASTSPALSSTAVRADGTYNAVSPAVSPGAVIVPSTQPNVQLASGNTTIFSGTYYPLPNYYTYHIPGGITYPIGPQIPNFISPMITTLPSTGIAYGYPGYGPGCHVYPGYPIYTSPYPLYGTTGVYYSGPIGGGGTIFSSTTTTSNGYGATLGNGGLNINIGNRRHRRSSSTTVTTSR